MAKADATDVAARLRALLERGPQTLSQLRKRLGARAGDRNVTGALSDMLRRGLVFEHPARAGQRSKRFALHAVDWLDYVRPALDAWVRESARRWGAPREELLATMARYLGRGGSQSHEVAGAFAVPRSATETGAASAEWEERAIIDAMLAEDSQAGGGALVRIDRLRGRLAGVFAGREEFDGAVLRLAQRGIVQLQAHGNPGALSPAEREGAISTSQRRDLLFIGLRQR